MALFQLLSVCNTAAAPTSAFFVTRTSFNIVRQLGRIRPLSAAFSSSSKNNNDNRLFSEELNIIYDSKCNVCKLEMDFLRKRDLKLAESNQRGPNLKFTDIEDVNFNPSDAANGGVSYERGMASMHAVTKDGKVVDGVPVFHLAYEQVGLGWLFAATKFPLVKRIADKAYDVFAKYRTNITRGQTLERLIEDYKEKQALEQQKEAADCAVCKDGK